MAGPVPAVGFSRRGLHAMRHRSLPGGVAMTGVMSVALVIGLLSGCAGITDQAGAVGLSDAGPPGHAAGPVRTDPRIDQRAYYAYSRSV